MPKPASPATRKPIRVRAKPAWSDYLTEDNKFALSREEVLRRKGTLLSKHNVFNGNNKSDKNINSRKPSIPMGSRAQPNPSRGVGVENSSAMRRNDVASNSSGRSGPLNGSSGPFSGYYDDDEAEGFPKESDGSALDLVATKQNKW